MCIPMLQWSRWTQGRRSGAVNNRARALPQCITSPPNGAEATKVNHPQRPATQTERSARRRWIAENMVIMDRRLERARIASDRTVEPHHRGACICKETENPPSCHRTAVATYMSMLTSPPNPSQHDVRGWSRKAAEWLRHSLADEDWQRIGPPAAVTVVETRMVGDVC